MADMFNVSAPDLLNLRRFWKRAPRLFLRASAGVLNEFGFGTRSTIFSVLEGEMEIRNPRFLKSKVRVDMARASQPMNNQRSEVGSIFGKRFSGWDEQELGKATDRDRVPTLFARGGDSGKQVRPSARMKPGNQFRSPSDVRGKSDHHRAIVLLIITNRENFRKPFILFGHDDIPSGLYKWQSKGKLMMLQEFNSDKAQPKRFKWLSQAVAKFKARVNVTQIWSKTLKRVLK